jgi:hypothetical protein
MTCPGVDGPWVGLSPDQTTWIARAQAPDDADLEVLFAMAKTLDYRRVVHQMKKIVPEFAADRGDQS